MTKYDPRARLGWAIKQAEEVLANLASDHADFVVDGFLINEPQAPYRLKGFSLSLERRAPKVTEPETVFMVSRPTGNSVKVAFRNRLRAWLEERAAKGGA